MAGLDETYPNLSSKIQAAQSAGFSDEAIQHGIQQKIQTATKAGYSVEAIQHALTTPSLMQRAKDVLSAGVQEVGRSVIGAYESLDPTKHTSMLEAAVAPTMATMTGTPPVVVGTFTGEAARKAGEQAGLSPELQGVLGVGANIAAGTMGIVPKTVGWVAPKVPTEAPLSKSVIPTAEEAAARLGVKPKAPTAAQVKPSEAKYVAFMVKKGISPDRVAAQTEWSGYTPEEKASIIENYKLSAGGKVTPPTVKPVTKPAEAPINTPEEIRPPLKLPELSKPLTLAQQERVQAQQGLIADAKAELTSPLATENSKLMARQKLQDLGVPAEEIAAAEKAKVEAAKPAPAKRVRGPKKPAPEEALAAKEMMKQDSSLTNLEALQKVRARKAAPEGAGPETRISSTGKKFTAGPNLDDSNVHFKLLTDKLASGELRPQDIQTLSSPEGGRAAVLLPDGDMIVRPTHGEAMMAVPEKFKGQVTDADKLIDVKTPYGQGFLTLRQLSQIQEPKALEKLIHPIKNEMAIQKMLETATPEERAQYEAKRAAGGTKLRVGFPGPTEITDAAHNLIVQPLEDLRTKARKLYAPARVSEIAGLAQRELTKGTSRMVENLRQVGNIVRYAKAKASTWAYDEMLAFLHNFEQGIRQPDPEKQRMADLMRGVLDWNQGQLVNRGMLKTLIDDYFPHMFDKPGVAQTVIKDLLKRQPRGSLSGPKYMLQQRTLIGTTQDVLSHPIAQQAGLRLRFNNPFETMEKLVFDSQRLIRGEDLKGVLKDNGLLHMYRTTREVPEGWKEVTAYRPPTRPVPASQAIDAPMVRIPSGKWYAPEDVARILNNSTSTGLLSGDAAWVPGFHAFRELAGTFNAVNLGWSSFHAVSTGFNSWANEGKRAIMSAKAGEYGEAAKRAGMFLTGPGVVARDIHYGKQLLKLADDPQMLANFPETAKLLRGYIDSGGRIDATRPFFNRFLNDAIQHLEDRAIAEGANPILAKALKGLTGTELIFKHVVAPAKIAGFARRYGDFIRQNPGMDDAALLKGSNAIMDQIENAFGMVNYDRWGIHRGLRDALFLTLRAPGWALGNMKILFGGMEDLARGQITERSATLASQIAAASLGGIALNIAFTGKPPEIDLSDPGKTFYNLWNPMTGGVNADGTPSRIAMAGIHRDWQTVMLKIIKPTVQGSPRLGFENTVAMATGKLSPPIHMFEEWRTNKDFYGRPMVDDAASAMQQAKQFGTGLLREAAPFSVTNIFGSRAAGQQRPWWQGGAFGVTPAASEKIFQSRFLELLAKEAPTFAPKTPAEYEHMQSRTELANRIANKQSVDDLLKSGKVNSTDMQRAVQALKTRGQPGGALMYALQHAQLQHIAKVAEAATPEEAPVILRMMQMKFFNSLQRGGMTKDRLDEYKAAVAALREKLPKNKNKNLPEPVGTQPNA